MSLQVNHARNVWDRAVTILPRANQFWYKFTYMEEMLKNIAGARQVSSGFGSCEPGATKVRDVIMAVLGESGMGVLFLIISGKTYVGC